MARVLITDGEHRAALAAVRSLGKAGHAVFVSSAERHSLAGASRYALEQHRSPDPLRCPDAFVESIRRELAQRRIDILLPITEASLLALLPVRQSLDVCMPFPETHVVERICNKAEVLDAAAHVGIAVPNELRLHNPEAAASLDFDRLRYPRVVKSARSVWPRQAGGLRTTVSHIHDASALFGLLQRLPSAAYPVLVQERIVGDGIGVFLLMRNGVPVAVFGHRRLREKPPSGGVSVLCESVPLPQSLLERSVALLNRLEWEGVAMVEFKADIASGEPYLMEINGRFWGSLQLAIDAGVDFPALLVAGALGERVDPVLSYAVGRRSRWLLGDVDQLLMRLRWSRRQLNLPDESRGHMQTVADFLRAFGPGHKQDVFRWSDPRPAGRELASWLHAAMTT